MVVADSPEACMRRARSTLSGARAFGRPGHRGLLNAAPGLTPTPTRPGSPAPGRSSGPSGWTCRCPHAATAARSRAGRGRGWWSSPRRRCGPSGRCRRPQWCRQAGRIPAARRDGAAVHGSRCPNPRPHPGHGFKIGSELHILPPALIPNYLDSLAKCGQNVGTVGRTRRDF